MMPTPTDEILVARRELAARLGNDIHLIAEETRRREHDSGRTYVSLPARPPQPVATPNLALQQTEATCSLSRSRSSPSDPGC